MKNYTFFSLFIASILLPLCSYSQEVATDVSTPEQKEESPPQSEIVNQAEVPNSQPSEAVVNNDINSENAEEPVINNIFKKDEKKEKIISVKQKYWKNGSLMFPENEMEWVYQAINSYEKDIPIHIVLPSLFPPADKSIERIENEMDKEKRNKDLVDSVLGQMDKENLEPLKEAPVFYLKSIFYIDDNNWTVWLNNEKITPETPHQWLDIIHVSRKEVSFLWKNTRLEEIEPDWYDEFKPIGDENSNFYSNSKNIVVDTSNGDISFVLGVNQSLDTKKMVIKEGKVAPTELKNENKFAAVEKKVDENGNEIPSIENLEPEFNIKDSITSKYNVDDSVKALYQTAKQINDLKQILEENGGL